MIVKSLPPKKYVEMFNENYEIVQGDNYFFAIMPNEFDDFRQFSYVNGLNISQGGVHVNYITDEVVNRLRTSLSKKYKEIKPGDIRNKLMIVSVLRDFKNLKFDSQTKEKVTNSITEVKQYFGDIDFDSLSKKILKNSALIDPITEVYKIKEEFKKRQELKSLEKPTKKVKSEKYLPAIKNKKYLILCEGASAVGGISPVLGREECGYYELKGKPLNVWKVGQSRFVNNKELSELYKIIQNEGYEYIVIASDQDLDGIHIRALLMGFIKKYNENYIDKLCVLQTPLVALKKAGKICKWFYNMEDYQKADLSGFESKYYKGLGSWIEKDLKFVVEKDGLDKMLEIVDFTDIDILNKWLDDDSEPRKEYILNNTFNIAVL